MFMNQPLIAPGVVGRFPSDEKPKEPIAEEGHPLSDECREKLSKTLCYVLRYGAEKKGLRVRSDGFVFLSELVPLIHLFDEAEILGELSNSISMRGIRRFELITLSSGELMARCTYGRRMERNPNHDGSHVKRLMYLCVDSVARNSDIYDFEDYGDDHMMNVILRRMRQIGVLTNKSLRTFLVPGIRHIDLWNVYVSDSTIRQMANKCTSLESVIFRDAGYVMNDQMLAYFMKRRTSMKSLNLVGCHHITETGLKSILKNGSRLEHLNLTFVPGVTDQFFIDLLKSCPNLKEFNAYSYKGPSEETELQIAQLTANREFRYETATHRPTGTIDSHWEHPSYRQ